MPKRHRRAETPSWRRVEKALDMIASGQDRQETIGWALLSHQIDDRSISKKDARMIAALSAELARVADFEDDWNSEDSDIVETNEDGERHDRLEDQG